MTKNLQEAREAWTLQLDRWAAAERMVNDCRAKLGALEAIEAKCKSCAHNAMIDWVEATNPALLEP